MKMDNLDSRNEPNPDGRFDFIDGTTINPRDGRVFFTQVEPFGKDLQYTIMGGDTSAGNTVQGKIAEKYIFEELIRFYSNQGQADLQKEQVFPCRGI